MSVKVSGVEKRDGLYIQVTNIIHSRRVGIGFFTELKSQLEANQWPVDLFSTKLQSESESLRVCGCPVLLCHC